METHLRVFFQGPQTGFRFIVGWYTSIQLCSGTQILCFSDHQHIHQENEGTYNFSHENPDTSSVFRPRCILH